MGKSIENKVVSLELDDSKFTGRVDGVLRNVDRLKSGMNFKQSTEGLDNVGKAAEDTSKRMGSIADGVKNVNTSIVNNSTTAAAATANVGAAAKISSSNFSMLAGAASVAMGNIASKALMAGGFCRRSRSDLFWTASRNTRTSLTRSRQSRRIRSVRVRLPQRSTQPLMS